MTIDTKKVLKNTWYKMKSRCLNKNDAAYKDYGKRGITVCKEWMSFETFCKDMGPRPSAKHSIDRIDNDKGYSKDNCRWATQKQQANNMRSNVRHSINGETLTVAQLSEKTGVGDSTLRFRLKSGMDLNAATRKENLSSRVIEYEGDCGNLTYFSKKYKISVPLISARLKSGFPLEEVFYKGNLNKLKKSQITKCKMGHFLSGDNLYVCRSSPTIRRCRTCKRSASKKYSRRTLSQALTPTPSEGEKG